MHRELAAPAAPTSEFADIAPFLDKALAELSPRDRDAIVLRFLEEKPLESVAVALGASPETARKRLQRAMAKLRRILAGRGLTLSISGLATVLAARTIDAVPPGLTASVSAAALSAATAGYTSLVLAKGAILMMTWQKYQFAALCAVAALLAAGALLLPHVLAQSPSVTPPVAASAPATGPAAYTAVIEIPLRRAAVPQANFIDLDSGKSATPPFAVPAVAERYPGVTMTPQLTAWLAENHVSLIVITDPTRISVTGLRTYSHALPSGLPEGILNPADAAAQKDAADFETSQSQDIIATLLPPRHVEGDVYFNEIYDLNTAFPFCRVFRTAQGTIGLWGLMGPSDEKAFNALPADKRPLPEKLSLRIKRVRPELVIQAAVAMLPDLSDKYSKFAASINAADTPAALKAADELFPGLDSFCFLIRASNASEAFDDAQVRLTSARASLAKGDLTAARGVIQDFQQLGPVLQGLAQAAVPKTQAAATRP
jgi:hypothetical protein